MFYVYILKSLKNSRNYTGFTSNLKRRFSDHNSKLGSVYTSKNAPYKLIYYEAYLSKKDAMKAERFYKSGYGREVLKDKLEDFFLKKS
jgi:putative endonuclease